MSLLSGRRVLVTGGCRGIGAAVVERFAAEGAGGAVFDLAPAVEQSQLPRGWSGHPVDVREEASVQAAIAQAQAGAPALDAVLFAQRRVVVRTTTRAAPRRVYCGMGTCFDCLVVVDGVPSTRACMTWVRDGMEVSSQHGLGPA